MEKGMPRRRQEGGGMKKGDGGLSSCGPIELWIVVSTSS